MFDIRFYQDFEDNTIGEYLDTEWEEDWNYPAWSDRDISPEIIRNEDADNGTNVMRFHFPEGSIGPTEGGGQWYTELDSGYYELYFSYRIKFKPGFNWVLGGKIPGIRGGPSWEGFGAPGWSDGYIVLLMWSSAPRIRFYYYHHDMDHLYGNSEDWNYLIESGIWYNITIRIVMNTLNEILIKIEIFVLFKTGATMTVSWKDL